MMGRLLVALLLGLCASLAWALEVVATTASMGMLVRTVGGPQVRVTVLAPPDRDPHQLQAKPSMMRALRDADLLVAVGAELEAGWLPAALDGAANPRLLPGRIGYFEAAAQVPLIDAGQPADRARGDVHPAGNPHVHLDPVRMSTIARALAERLVRLDPARAADYRARAEAFARTVQARLPAWRAQVAGSAGAVLYHKDGVYLLERLGLPLLGTLEPIPGVPPTARHLQGLIERLQGRKGVVLYHAYQPAQGPQRVAEALGWPVQVVPMEPPADADADGYLRLIDQWVAALALAR
ncbi:MAG: zinc ABC transporter substrate-binding protein [Thiobacillaceae bacterium]|nr:zinc ABC transporter substrate-binding protein [Thiobacillaceae bacterium]